MPPKRKNSAGCNSAAKRCRRTATSDENAPPKKCTNRAKAERVPVKNIFQDEMMPTLPTNVLEETLNDFVTEYLALAQHSRSHSYSELTFLAILSSPDKCLTVEEIYEFVQTHFPAYWHKELDPRKRIRHAVAKTRCFAFYQLTDAEPSSSDDYTHSAFKIKTLYAVTPQTFVTKISTGAYRKTPADKKIFKKSKHPWANNEGKKSELWKNVSRFMLLDVYQRIQAIETSRNPLRCLNTPNRRTSVASRTSPEPMKPDATRTPLGSLNTLNRITFVASRTPTYDDVDLYGTFMNIDEADELKETDETDEAYGSSTVEEDEDLDETFAYIDGQPWPKELDDLDPLLPCNGEEPDPVLIQVVDLDPLMPNVDKDPRKLNVDKDPLMLNVDKDPMMPCVDKDPLMPCDVKDPRMFCVNMDLRLPYGDEQPEDMPIGLIDCNPGWSDDFDVFKYLGPALSLHLFPGLEY